MRYMPAIAVLSACLCSMPAVAQTPSTEGGAPARVHWGAVYVNPTFAVTNIGVDTNVFNSNEANRPQSDFTTTLTPGADAWLHVRRSIVTASVKEDLVYYRQFASERSVNGYYKVGAVVPLNRLSYNLGAGWLSARDRPGFEIDARSLRTESDAHAGFELRAWGKTFLSGTIRRSTVRFDEGAEFNGANLNQELSRVVTAADVSLRHLITPVTTLTVDVSREQDRFLFNPERDSTSTRVVGGARFGTRLAGSAAFGYRAFEPHAADLPVYHGLVANADVSFTTVGSTRLGVRVIRDVDYSYDFRQPYYVQTGATASYTHSLFGPLNGSARLGLQQLAYRGRLGLAVPVADRTDHIVLVGGSVGYRVAGGVRVSFNVDQQQRNSDLAGASYGGLRYGTSVTYGF